MKLTVTCPNSNCGKKYQLSEAHIGRRFRCKECNTPFEFLPSETNPVLVVEATETSDSLSPRDGMRSSPTPLPSKHLPDYLGRFEIRQLIGRGGFGAVYRAH